MTVKEKQKLKMSLSHTLLKYSLKKLANGILIGLLFVVYHLIFHTHIPILESGPDPGEVTHAADTEPDPPPQCVHLPEQLTASETEALRIATPLVARYEGLRLNRYMDEGEWSIGYGHRLTGPEANIRDISQAQAECYLMEDLRQSIHFLESVVTVTLNPNQTAALMSWVYNVGPSAARHSTLIEKLNEGYYSSVPRELNRWVHAGHHVLDILVQRRHAEGQIWDTGS